MSQNVSLLIIDPQIDFCDPAGALYVPHAEHDMQRLAAMIRRLQNRLDKIHVTLDSHHLVHIANPIFWQDVQGQHPAPFTQISAAEVTSKKWRATKSELQTSAENYVAALETKGRYQLTIWPPHCLLGSRGHAVFPVLYEALQEWEQQYNVVEYVLKGSSLLTEHYSALKAEVPVPDEPATQMNTQLIRALEQSDIIAIAGEARTHCVANTVRDIADNFSAPASMAKLVLLTDTMSDIPGFENFAEDFVNDLTARGMQLATTENFLA